MKKENIRTLKSLSKNEKKNLYHELPEYEGLQKLPWGIFISISSILFPILFIAFFAVWFVFDAIAAQTHTDAGPFDSWWQILLLVMAIIMAAVDGVSIYFYNKLKGEKKKILEHLKV